MLTTRQIALVQSTFEQIRPTAGEAAGIFYRRLFEIDPSLRHLFRDNIEEQGDKLMQALALTVAGLGMLETIQPAIESLGRRHAGYGVIARDYQTVGVALLWTLEEALGPRFSPEVRGAWEEAYRMLSAIMMSAGESVKTGRNQPFRQSNTRRIES